MLVGSVAILSTLAAVYYFAGGSVIPFSIPTFGAIGAADKGPGRQGFGETAGCGQGGRSEDGGRIDLL